MIVTAELLVGAQAKLAPTPYDASNRPLSGRAFAYSSSAPNVATVDANGLVTALAIGVTTITATAEGKSVSATLRVVPQIATVVASSVAITPPNTATTSLPAGQTLQLTATPQDATGNPLSSAGLVWSSSAPLVAAVNAITGLVTGAAIGTAVITASVAGLKATITVAVTQAQDGSLADVRAVIGDANILRWADFTIPSTLSWSGAVGSSNITAATDARGTLYGATLVGHGTSGPTMNADGGAQITQDSDQYMQWVASEDFNLQRQADIWVAMVIAVNGINGNPFVSIDDGSTSFGASAQAVGMSARSDTTPHMFDFNAFHGPGWSLNSLTLWNPNRTPVPSDLTTYRLIIFEKHRGPATQQGVFNEMRAYEVYGAGRTIELDSGTTEPDYLDEIGVLNWGRESGLTSSTGSKCKAILAGIGPLPAVQRQALARYAFRLGALLHATANAVATVPTKLVTIAHDSNGAGYGTSNTDTKAWPVLMQGNLGSAYLVKQDGWAGTTAVDHAYWFAQIAEPQINTLAIPKHVHIVGTQGTNDLFALAVPGSAKRIIAALQSQCVQAKAGGSRVLLFTIPRSGTDNEGNNPTMAAVNTWGRGAVAAGFADALFDIYTVLGAPSGGGVHFNDAENVTIEANVRPLVIALAA